MVAINIKIRFLEHVDIHEGGIYSKTVKGKKFKIISMDVYFCQKKEPEYIGKSCVVFCLFVFPKEN